MIGHVCDFTDGNGTYKMRVGKRVVFFNFSPMFGPLVTGPNGEDRAQPRERDRFWLVFQSWLNAGKPVGDDGFCVTPELLG